MTARGPVRVALIADTHGLLRPEVAAALAGAPLILHAGDVGKSAVLDALTSIAPTRAIRGNVDRGGWAAALPAEDLVEVAGRRIHVLHDRKDLALDPSAAGAGFDVVLSGHSHKPAEERRDGVLYVNPGSCGPRRFSLPISMAWLTLGDGEPAVEFVTFQGRTARGPTPPVSDGS